jgi:hypothetical protein
VVQKLLGFEKSKMAAGVRPPSRIFENLNIAGTLRVRSRPPNFERIGRAVQKL